MIKVALKRQLLETINRCDDLDHPFQILARQIGEYFHADRCLIIFYNRNDSNVITRLEQYSRVSGQDTLIQDLPKRSDVLQNPPAASDGFTALVRYNSPDDFPDFYLPYAQKYQVQASLGFDFIQRGQRYGRLILNKTDQPYLWTESEAALLQEITHIIGVAIRQEELKIEDKTTRQILEESERRFRLLVEGVRDYAIYLEDPNGIIHTWNEGAERLFGYTEQEIIGKPFSTFFTQQELDSGLFEHELEVATRDGRFEIEGYRVRKDGSQCWASILITALYNQDDCRVGFSSITPINRASPGSARP